MANQCDNNYGFCIAATAGDGDGDGRTGPMRFSLFGGYGLPLLLLDAFFGIDLLFSFFFFGVLWILFAPLIPADR